MKHLIRQTYRMSLSFGQLLEKSHSIAAIIARFYIAQVFFKAGLTKIENWDTTLFLFEEEYQVPLLTPTLAAYSGTLGELLFPVLLLLGLATRFSALGLFVVNAVAVISLETIAPAALYLHIIWGILLAQVAIYGAGIFSLDKLIHAAKTKTAATARPLGYEVQH